MQTQNMNRRFKQWSTKVYRSKNGAQNSWSRDAKERLGDHYESKHKDQSDDEQSD